MNDALHKLLALRPTNAATLLGHSFLPLLNPRDLQRALEGRSGAVLCAPAYSRLAVSGLLSAARHQDAIVGIGCQYPLSERDAPQNLLAELLRAGTEIAHTRPFFLQGGPFRLRSEDPRAVELLSAQVFRYVEGGCSLISLDASALELGPAAKAYATLSESARERELSVEIAVVRDPSGAPSAEETRTMLDTLAEVGMAPRYIRADVGTLIDDGVLRTDRVAELSQVAKEHGLELAVEDLVGLDASFVKGCVEAGARKWDASESFARRVAPALPPGAVDALQRRAWDAGRSWTELLGALSEGLSSVGDDAVRMRLEAFAYEEAAQLISTLGGRGSARVASGFLFQDSAY